MNLLGPVALGFYCPDPSKCDCRIQCALCLVVLSNPFMIELEQGGLLGGGKVGC